jgi:hypothetical protein
MDPNLPELCLNSGEHRTAPDRPMNLKTLLPYLFLVLLIPTDTRLHAQHVRSANLSETEIEQVREAAVLPDTRVKLYTKFLEERAAKIKDLTGRPKSSQRILKLDDALQDFTALMDEMGSNLDQYSDRHSDIRKSLKPLSEEVPHWVNILRTLPGESGFDLARKEAIESGEELADQATRLLREQDDYFATHKDEKNQERNDDQMKPEAPKN